MRITVADLLDYIQQALASGAVTEQSNVIVCGHDGYQFDAYLSDQYGMITLVTDR